MTIGCVIFTSSLSFHIPKCLPNNSSAFSLDASFTSLSTLDPVSDSTKKIIEVNSSIEYLGPQYGTDLLACYAASDCFVFPSYREGFPNTVLEAGAMELPSIVTDINGSREIIVCRNEENTSPIRDMKICDNGIIIPSRNEELLYKAMEEVFKNDNVRAVMVSQAREMVATRFEQSFVQKCLLDFYEEII